MKNRKTELVVRVYSRSFIISEEMRVCNDVRGIREWRKWVEKKQLQVGLIPTMGALHDGHLSLIQQARIDGCTALGVSIFVNPTQFGPNEDLLKYPKDLDGDIKKIKSVVDSAKDVVCIFAPPANSLYSKDHSTWVVPDLDLDPNIRMHYREAQSRPNHFRGVSTIVSKLFNIYQPHQAYFGQKDGMQSILIRKMVSDLNFPVAINICETLRDPEDRLALSSRNVYLSNSERKAASAIPRSLLNLQDEIQKSLDENEGTCTISKDNISKALIEEISKENSLRVDYISLANATTGEEIQTGKLVKLNLENPMMVSVAVYCGTTRLIDNIILPRQKFPIRTPVS